MSLASNPPYSNGQSANELQQQLRHNLQMARQLLPQLARLTTEQKNLALNYAANLLTEPQWQEKILTANQRDVNFYQQQSQRNFQKSFLARLSLTANGLNQMANGLKAIAEQPDPVGIVLAEWQRPNGLIIKKIATPLGLLLVIYESRPNVTLDVAALALKSGNGCMLRGGSESFYSSEQLVLLFQTALSHAKIPTQQTQMLKSRERDQLMQLLQYPAELGGVDLVIPRGGRSLVENVMRHAVAPVWAHLMGNCHVYVHHSADANMATEILVNGKLRRTEVCGATESLLVDFSVATEMLPRLLKPLVAAGVELRACPRAYAIINNLGKEFSNQLRHATETDYSTEYLDKIISIKLVPDVTAAINHINHYGSHHTDAIVATDDSAAAQFLNQVDSAIVLHNASTQFADGGEFGFGGEVGIATGKFHARGPIGAAELCSYHYQIQGSGQCRP